MAVKVVKKSHGGTIKEVLAKYKKSLGDTIGAFGGHEMSMERIPTGIFAFDLATGGGFPKGRCSCIFGPESSNKTNIALMAIASNQKINPKEINVYVAIEPFDGVWAAKMGVDVEKLLVVYPSFAEEAIDMIEGFLLSEDCGIVVLDSIAAMITVQEADSDATKANPGAPLIVGKLVRKTIFALREAEKVGRAPTLIYINQNRFKIGVMYGNPEEMPGGQAPRFQAALWVRVHGKNVIDSKVHSTLPVLKETNFTIKKFKVPITSASGVFQLVVHPHSNMAIGETADWSTIKAYLNDLGAMVKSPDGKGWLIIHQPYPTQEAFRKKVYEDKTFGRNVRLAIINKVMSTDGALIPPNDTAGEPKIDPETGEVLEEEEE